jgi:very-short-patch-repair endonuclease
MISNKCKERTDWLMELGKKYVAESTPTECELLFKSMLDIANEEYEFQKVMVVDNRTKSKKKRELAPNDLKMYILDFFLPKYNVCYEIDGRSVHWTKEGRAKDRIRDRVMNSIGIRTIRLTNDQVRAINQKGFNLLIKQTK